MVRLRYLLVLTLVPDIVRAQTNCDQAPTPAMRTVCMQLNEWDDNARTQPVASPVGGAAPGVAGLVEVLSVLPATITDPASCNDIACICGLVGGTMSSGFSCRLPSGAIYRKGIRKEYRMMSDAERDRFHAAMWTLKRNGDYDRLAHIHANVNQAPSAHSGPSFLPWHREYVKRFEISLRLIDPSISLPYWDSTLDGALTDVKYSSLWSDELMGSVMNGAVTSGVFRGWSGMNGGTIMRNLGKDSGRVLNTNDRNLALGKTRIESVMAFTSTRRGCPYSVEWDNIEFAHGYSHVYVGGDMLVQHTAAFDPIFFLYHSFIDSLWEDWRNQRQSRTTRPTAYPPNNAQCSSIAHFSNSTMSPFAQLQNIDGCSNDYTDNLYAYDTRRPSCSLGENCGSKFLFCDRSHGGVQCAAKIRLGQPCTGYSRGEDMCYNSVCIRGFCSQAPTVAPTPPTTTPPIRTVPTQAPASESCFNEHECCGPWQARGECTRNAAYMRTWCQASCDICTPRLYSLFTECSDRHFSCRAWAAGGECTNNPMWMNENCRLSCNRCSSTREQTCFPPNQAVTTMAPVTWTRRWRTRRPITRRPFITRRPRPWWFTTGPRGDMAEEVEATTPTLPPGAENCAPSCTDHYLCCEYWASQDYCTRSSEYMRCNCPVACNFCQSSFASGSCANYADDCNRRAGLCATDHWTAQNCRVTCGACMSAGELADYCMDGTQQQSRRPHTFSRGSKSSARRVSHRRPLPPVKGFNETGPYPPHPHLHHNNRNAGKSRPRKTKMGEKRRGEGRA
ncbi:hypothetical protein PMAYCL1PPCAC_04605 [Pristionchus mayeri]|uniref:ShKT domain-containing protein n=1 Tax=Pristionchus mayeri TaxID=1317129 RepID=A0AAN4ZCE4_9BILA|nr:hypothetical protein PMAYCL1PPCAC_04605 [Pristionchus mayeri]